MKQRRSARIAGKAKALSPSFRALPGIRPRSVGAVKGIVRDQRLDHTVTQDLIRGDGVGMMQVLPDLAPAECRSHLFEDRLDNMGVVVDAQLVRHGQQQCVGLGDGFVGF